MNAGERYGALVADRPGEPAVSVSGRKRMVSERWWFNCDCGGSKLIRTKDVIRGASRSCNACWKQRIARGIKRCPSCTRDLPVTAFGAASNRADGLAGNCKECMGAVGKSRYRADLERSRAASRARARADYHGGRRQPRPPSWKRNAHAAVERALRHGRLVRPIECSCCGKTDRIEAHHDDYSKPLDVMWLCVMCHRVRHAELEAAGRDPDLTAPLAETG